MILAIVLLLVVSAAAGGAIWTLRVYNSAPALSGLKPRKQARVTKVYAADGSQLGVIHSDTIREPVAGNKITPG